jgi:hypothetical protein
MTTRHWVGTMLLVWGTLAGCSYDPAIPEGTIACDPKTAQPCPGGLSCIAGFCRTHAADASGYGGTGGHETVDGSPGGETTGDGAQAPDGHDATIDAIESTGPMDAGSVDHAGTLDVGTRVDAPPDAPSPGNDDAVRSFVADSKPAPDTEATQDAARDAAPDQVPQLVPDLAPERDLAPSPDIEPLPGPDAPPDSPTPDTSTLAPDLGPDSAPDTAPDTVADLAADLASDPAPQPDTAPDLGPDLVACPDPCTLGNRRCGSATTIETCQSVAGCPQFVLADTCQGVTTCQAGAGYTCQCPAGQPSDCAQGAGSYCPSETQRLTCQQDAQGCWSTSTFSCGASQYCVGSFPDGQCATASVLGYATQFSGTSTIPTGNLVGIPVSVAATTTLRKLGFITNASSVSASAGLYTDNGAGPRMLVAANNGFALAAGRTEVAPTWPSATVELAPGQYWILLAVSASTPVYQDVTGAGSIVYRYYPGYAQGNPLPNPIGTTSSANIKPINFYLLTTP